MKNMVGPTKQFNQDEALQNALDIFWTKGFTATSMQELVNAMGVNRASMYQTYGNKSELYSAAIDRYTKSSLQYIRALLEAPTSPMGNLQQLFNQLIELSFNKMSGCFMGNTAAELGPHNVAVAEKIRNFWIQFEDIISSTLERAIEHNELQPNTDTIKLASFVNSNLQGLLIKSKASVDKGTLKSDIDLLFKLIKE